LTNIEKVTETADRLGVRIIDVKFAHFCTMAYSCQPGQLPPTQLREVRSAFMAGMVLYQGDILQTVDDDPAVEAYCLRIMDELEQYAEHQLAEAMKTEGNA
jgi:hypothetical protein